VIYLDTSVAVALLVPEPGSAMALRWFGRLDALPGLSDWTVTEFASALSIKERTGQLSKRDVARVRREFDSFCAGLRVLPVSRESFTAATALAARPELGLRSGDALHLAVAMGAAATTIATLDRAMAEASERLGVRLEALA